MYLNVFKTQCVRHEHCSGKGSKAGSRRTVICPEEVSLGQKLAVTVGPPGCHPARLQVGRCGASASHRHAFINRVFLFLTPALLCYFHAITKITSICCTQRHAESGQADKIAHLKAQRTVKRPLKGPGSYSMAKTGESGWR